MGTIIINLANSWIGYLILSIFVLGYIFIALEDKYRINKAKIALFIGTLMFILIGIYFKIYGLDIELVNKYISHSLIEISEIVFFLFVAMVFIETMIERNVFELIRYKLLVKGFSYKQLFWILGFLAFFLSPVADNLTTALILSTVMLTLAKDNKKFLVPTAINIVVAANAGGVWSPFGDVTTLMAWTYGKAEFFDFFKLFPAAFIGWFLTAYLLSKSISNDKLLISKNFQEVKLKKGALGIVGIGIFTLIIAISLEQFLHIPPMWGMMFGLSVLKLYVYYLKVKNSCRLDVFEEMRKIEFDTLLFFFGILSAVGALHFLGYLLYITKLYDLIGLDLANIFIGIISSVIDNVPVMAAVLKSDLKMSVDHRLLLTLTIGLGGSLVSFGSAAGVAVMGRAKGVYTAINHFKYLRAVAIGFSISILIFWLQIYYL